MNVRTSWFSYLFFPQACLIKAKLEWNGDIFSSATKKRGTCPQSSKIVSFMQKMKIQRQHNLFNINAFILICPKVLYWKALKYQVFVVEEVFVKNPNTLRSPSEIFGTSGRIGDVRATSRHRLENFRKFSAAGGYQIMSNV